MVVVAVLSATMSESAIDSLQNAIVDNISGTFLKFLPLIWTRFLVCVLNIPVMVVSLQVTPHSNQNLRHAWQEITPYLIKQPFRSLCLPDQILRSSCNVLTRTFLRASNQKHHRQF